MRPSEESSDERGRVDFLAVLLSAFAVFVHSSNISSLDASFLRYDDVVNFQNNPLMKML